MTNAASEGLNSKIQLYKASARGFHSFESYRARILFYCGKLDMAITR
jgi:transposase